MSNWLKLMNPELGRHYESEKLQKYSLKYCTLISYERVSELLKERCGNSGLSDQRLSKMVLEKAAEITHRQQQMVAAQQTGEIKVKAEKVDVYDWESEEIIWLADGICVSEQKSQRDKRAKVGKERTTTEMAMLQTGNGSYKTLVAGAGVERVAYYQAEVVAEYGEKAQNLQVVAISDGARSIKNEVKKVFGEEVCHILDWYHIEAKVYQLMTQIAVNKEAKREAGERIINLLWEGETGKAVAYLGAMASKNVVKQNELLGYLEKNKDSIINYGKRKEAGKIIGSGRMEKQNDVIVAHRQKRKGMSWSKQGSWSLAIVTAHFNQRTNYLQ